VNSSLLFGDHARPRSRLLIAVRARNSTVRALFLYFSTTPALPFPMVVLVPAQISDLPPRLSTLRRRPALASLPAFGRKSLFHTPNNFPVICTTWRQYLSRSEQLPHTSRRHGGVYPPSFPTTDFPAFRHANSFAFKSLQPLCRLFVLFSALVSFVFNRLQPLFPKHPGWGVSTFPAAALRIRPRAADTLGVPK
jgi:hypothetical protein